MTFDPTYFDGAYFDTPAAETTGRRPVAILRRPVDDDEVLALLDFEDY